MLQNYIITLWRGNIIMHNKKKSKFLVIFEITAVLFFIVLLPLINHINFTTPIIQSTGNT